MGTLPPRDTVSVPVCISNMPSECERLATSCHRSLLPQSCPCPWPTHHVLLLRLASSNRRQPELDPKTLRDFLYRGVIDRLVRLIPQIATAHLYKATTSVSAQADSLSTRIHFSAAVGTNYQPTAGKGPMPVWVITLSSEVKVALSQISLLRPKHFSDVDVIRVRHTSSALLWGGDYSCSTSTCLVYPRANSAKQIIANS